MDVCHHEVEHHHGEEGVPVESLVREVDDEVLKPHEEDPQEELKLEDQGEPREPDVPAEAAPIPEDVRQVGEDVEDHEVEGDVDGRHPACHPPRPILSPAPEHENAFPGLETGRSGSNMTDAP